MTKSILSILGGIAGLALLLAVPVWAGEMSQVTDSDLAGISGKVNTYLFSGALTTDQANTNGSSANISVGWYQWSDDHTADTSDHKGANDQSGSDSTVQQNVVATANVIQWGAWATTNWNTASETSTGTIISMAYATMANGGF